MNQNESIINSGLLVSDKLYFGSFAVQKTIISATFKHPLFKNDICHKFHIGELQYHATPEEFQDRLKCHKTDPQWINKADLTKELNLFIKEPKNRANYFYFEVCDGLKKLPLYYASIYNRDCFSKFEGFSPENNPPMPLWSKYIQECQKAISNSIYMGTIHPSCYYDLFTFFHDFGFEVFEWLDKENPEYIDEPFLTQSLEKYQRHFKLVKDVALRNYALAVVKSVIEQSIKNKDFIQCAYCGRLIDYRIKKRYCSPLSEKRDCAKKARNKRYYEKIGSKKLNIYRIKSQELRAFKKEKNIKK